MPVVLGAQETLPGSLIIIEHLLRAGKVTTPQIQCSRTLGAPCYLEMFRGQESRTYILRHLQGRQTDRQTDICYWGRLPWGSMEETGGHEED